MLYILKNYPQKNPKLDQDYFFESEDELIHYLIREKLITDQSVYQNIRKIDPSEVADYLGLKLEEQEKN